ncbi:GNAT family N-acetyltransferase [Laceyella putida]|uniref:GNAT family N-acetyltransferase n=1 Tax=Laceyella putida TaxID=110101 RepID=A0ABW2RGH7_9BACL
MFVIRRAIERDVFQVRKLLKEAGLNDKGINDHIEHFFVVEMPAEEGMTAQLVGAVGMEVYKPYGLLRSFVLERAPWNTKVGMNMIQILLSYAGKLRLSHVYLLAGASQEFFTQMGFSEIEHEKLPAEIQESEHVERSRERGTPMVYSCFPTRQH